MNYIGIMTQSEIVTVDRNNLSPEIVDKAVRVLNSGELVVAPTDTRYGLLAKVDDLDAVNRLFEIKGREANKPSAVFISNVKMLDECAHVSHKAQILANKFLPGPLTLVLKSKQDLGKFFTLNKMTGFRISSSPLITNLVQHTGPLSATSANLSGEKELDSVAEIRKQLGDKIELYIDGGKLNNPASTVVSVIDDQVRILREGAIAKKEILDAVNS
ncbi:MAG TPA: L-threonylcarbamoyladenylate synthase [candidate division Zixibacteria bacterium]|nr:L-threonylcarbamoyladenylate synthase [candidate division Zixibacteria bacterium]